MTKYTITWTEDGKVQRKYYLDSRKAMAMLYWLQGEGFDASISSEAY